MDLPSRWNTREVPQSQRRLGNTTHLDQTKIYIWLVNDQIRALHKTCKQNKLLLVQNQKAKRRAPAYSRAQR